MTTPRFGIRTGASAWAPWLRRAAFAAAILDYLLLAGGTALSSSLQVTAAASQRGALGLRVGVGSTCTSPQHLTVNNQSLAGPATHEGCQTVSSSQTTVASGTVTFRAGDGILLGDSFFVQSGATFLARIEKSLLSDAFVEKDLPPTSPPLPHPLPHYAAGFFINASNLSLGNTDSFVLLRGDDPESGDTWFSVLLKRNVALNEKRIVIEARRNDGSIVSTDSTNEVVLPSGWSWLSIDWKAATASGSNGFLRVYLGSLLGAERTGLSNSNGLIRTVRLGATGVDSGTTGSFDLDHFTSRMAGPIAPPP